MDSSFSSDNGQTFEIRLLTEDDASVSSDLLNKVAEEMHLEGHDTYIHAKKRAQMLAAISNPENLMAGIFLVENGERKLIAEMGYFAVPENSSRGAKGDWLPNFGANNVPNEDIAYMGSACVDKEFRNLGLLKKMDLFLAECTNKRFLVAMIDIQNYRSFVHFLDSKFILAQKTVDPSDGGKIFYLIKDKNTATSPVEKVNYENCIAVSINSGNYEKNMNLLFEQGFVGVGFDREKGAILFEKREDVLNSFGYASRPDINSRATKIGSPVLGEAVYA